MTNFYDREGNPLDVERWVFLSELGSEEAIMAYKRVAQDQVGPYWVSTVWLGIDHNYGDGPPLIFETMVFATSSAVQGLGPDLDCRRYSTEAQARAGHDEMVLLVRATLQEEPDLDDNDKEQT